MLKLSGIILALLTVSFATSAQVMQDTTSRKADIIIEQSGNKASFSAQTPPLIQISGAPQAFYTYFWEFGDGNYSFKENPEHVYKDKGEYEVRLQVTNNYDNGKPPPSRPQPVKVGSIDHQPLPVVEEYESEGLAMLKTREPVPDEEMVVVMSYENKLASGTNGKLYLYFNERKFKASNFKIVEVRTHHGERQVENMLLSQYFNTMTEESQWASLSSGQAGLRYFGEGDSTKRKHIFVTIDESEQEFSDKLIFDFRDLAPGQRRNIFFTFKTTPEMIKDTSAIVKIRGVFVPDERSGNHQVEDLEMEITTSHDPNKMAVSDTRLNYRTRKHKKLKYKVRFQNNGEGPATTIKLDVDVPDIMDKSSLEVLDMHPKCPICPDNVPQVSYSCLDTLFSESQISFIFRNIYLPGSRQKGVEKYDSTKGFVQYRVKLKEKAPKVNSTSRTAIIFDKNEPILTNYAKTRFKPGLSLGAMAGYKAIRGLEDSKDYFFGVAVSPYMPHHGYLQAELQMSIGSYKDFNAYEVRTPFPNGIELTDIESVTEDFEYNYLNITLVPASYRYNISRFLGFGGGVQVSTKLFEREQVSRDYQYFIEFDGGREPSLDRNRTETVQATERTTDFNFGVFTGVDAGVDRIGPRAGVRYIYQARVPHNQWMFYLMWKF
ncbi:hypothetical protein C900_05430 [Fulvivirga imtechensis AK7]|uniref:PKD domain-containing protein n=1 Tax=Fulvivirga imtechensis AK7 TaxID=1237149 RepID=L8JK11_9BACT|nr:PKD domain-containing protein [Fulvivirga imtechensis]ELR69150.1 hypothetical protein C900_05430 [Fulvivirga imtechensis AK7]